MPRYSDDEPPQKKRKGLIVALVIILCLAVAAAGVASYFLFFKGSSAPDSFDYNCAKLTDELNRVLEAEGSSTKLSLNKWKYNQAEPAFEYQWRGLYTARRNARKGYHLKNQDSPRGSRSQRAGTQHGGHVRYRA